MTKKNDINLETLRREGEVRMSAKELQHSNELWNATLAVIGGATDETK